MSSYSKETGLSLLNLNSALEISVRTYFNKRCNTKVKVKNFII
jgi:hypothetical protein